MAVVDATWFEEVGLYDSHGPNAADRLAMLEFLVERGATADDLQRAAEQGGLPGLPGELFLRHDGRHLTIDETARRSGTDVETIERVLRSAGLPAFDRSLPMFHEDDPGAFVAYVDGAAAFGDAATLEFARAIGAALASIADSAMAIFGINVASQFSDRGTSEFEQARASHLAVEMLMSGVPDVIDALFRLHVGAAMRRAGASRSADSRTATLAVGFVDLVASTSLSLRLDPKTLTDAIGGFEHDAVRLIGAGGGRVVKTIGDEVMFVHADPVEACLLALSLRDAVTENALLGGVRGGLAIGDLVLGYGDFYGPEVNLAARLVKAAEPGQILITADIAARAQASDAITVLPFDDIEVAGFDERVSIASIDRSG